MNQRWKWTVWVLAGIVAIGALFGPRIPQDQNYHRFADQRTVLAIPHFFDVVSNVGFLVIGVWGLVFVLKVNADGRAAFLTRKERWPYLLFFFGVLLTAFGSAYYHWAPDNARLLWDRLPMTVGFMALLAAVLGERVAAPLAARTLGPLMAAGIVSVVYWRWTDLAGRDDLRMYGVVQFGSLALVLVLCSFLPSRYTHGRDMFVIVAFYALAKLLEAFDKQVFALGGFVSGHTLKHLAAAVACYLVLRMLVLRRPTTD
jgi:hypothetical protein